MLLPLLLLLFYAIKSSVGLDHGDIAKECEELNCFTLHDCFEPPLRDKGVLHQFNSTTTINKTCKYIMMIRRFTKRKFLIVMATLKPKATRITMTLDGQFDLKCSKDRSEEEKIRAFYDQKEQILIPNKKDASNLECEFIVDFGKEIYDNERDAQLLISPRDKNETHISVTIKDILTLPVTCDPVVFKTIIRSEGDFTYEPLVPRRNLMKCRDEDIAPESERDKIEEIKCENGFWQVKIGDKTETLASTATKEAYCKVFTKSKCDFKVQKPSRQSIIVPYTKFENGERTLNCPVDKPNWLFRSIGDNGGKSERPRGIAHCVFAGEKDSQAEYHFRLNSGQGFNISKATVVNCIDAQHCKYMRLHESICTGVEKCKQMGENGWPTCEDGYNLNCWDKKSGEFKSCIIRCWKHAWKIAWKVDGMSTEGLNMTAFPRLECKKNEDSDSDTMKWVGLAIGLSAFLIVIILVTLAVSYICWRQHRRELEDNGILTRKKNKKKKKKNKAKKRLSQPSSSNPAVVSSNAVSRSRSRKRKLAERAIVPPQPSSATPATTPSTDGAAAATHSSDAPTSVSAEQPNT